MKIQNNKNNKIDKIEIYEDVIAEHKEKYAKTIDKEKDQEKDNLLKFIAEFKKINRANILFLNSQINSLNNLSKNVLRTKEGDLKTYLDKLNLLKNIEENFKDTQLYKNNKNNKRNT